VPPSRPAPPAPPPAAVKHALLVPASQRAMTRICACRTAQADLMMILLSFATDFQYQPGAAQARPPGCGAEPGDGSRAGDAHLCRARCVRRRGDVLCICQLLAAAAPGAPRRLSAGRPCSLSGAASARSGLAAGPTVRAHAADGVECGPRRVC
jgi:hypothetical protein